MSNEKHSKDKDVSKPSRAASPPPVTESIAHTALHHAIITQLHLAGFSSTPVLVLEELERTVLQYLMEMYTLALEYARVSNRLNPNAFDLLAACLEAEVDISQLRHTAHKRRKQALKFKAPTLGQTPSTPSAPSFLPSDESDEDNEEEGAVMSSKKAASTKAKTDNKSSKKSSNRKMDAGISKYLRDLPKQFPELPPKHTFLRSAAPPPPTRTLASLEAKYADATSLQESLRVLVQGTEDPLYEPTSFPDGKSANSNADSRTPPTLEESGIGGIVNFERAERTFNGTLKRKRWKI